MNANVAFLNGNASHLSTAQIASYISIATSIGSIILGLLLVRQNRTKSRENAEDVVSATHLILLNSLNEARRASFCKRVHIPLVDSKH